MTRRTPEELWTVFDGLTDMQAAKVIAPFIGQWIEVTEAVRGVGDWDGRFSQLTVYRGEGLISRPVYCLFRDEAWVPRLATLSEGDQITLVGEIERIDRVSIQITNCELVDA